MICAGIDCGSRTVKVVLLRRATKEVVARCCEAQNARRENLVRDVYNAALAQAGVAASEVGYAIATGYGRHRVAFADEAITEITCHACGVHQVVPGTQTIVEIGGQDSKIIRINKSGLVQDFIMNDRCAAGTGRFLEMVASLLGLAVEDLGLSYDDKVQPAQISSTCAVFAETEILGLLTNGCELGSIVAGVQDAVASRLATMAGSNPRPPIAFTGGVALIAGMREALSRKFGVDLELAPDPQFTGALGAALIAAEHAPKETRGKVRATAGSGRAASRG